MDWIVSKVYKRFTLNKRLFKFLRHFTSIDYICVNLWERKK